MDSFQCCPEDWRFATVSKTHVVAHTRAAGGFSTERTSKVYLWCKSGIVCWSTCIVTEKSVSPAVFWHIIVRKVDELE